MNAKGDARHLMMVAQFELTSFKFKGFFFWEVLCVSVCVCVYVCLFKFDFLILKDLRCARPRCTSGVSTKDSLTPIHMSSSSFSLSVSKPKFQLCNRCHQQFCTYVFFFCCVLYCFIFFLIGLVPKTVLWIAQDWTKNDMNRNAFVTTTRTFFRFEKKK